MNFADTGAILSAVSEKLNNNSYIDTLNAVIDAVNDTTTTSDQELQSQIDLIRTQITALQNEANILGTDELRQVEEAIKQMLQNLEQQGFLGDLCLTIGGTQYKLKELVKSLLLADRVRKIENVYNAEVTEVIKAKFTLEDGSIVVFDATTVEDQYTKTVTFETGSWKGMPASFEIGLIKVTKTVAGNDFTVFVPKYQTNVLFDLTRDAVVGCPEPEDVIDEEVVTPDLNEDGEIGGIVGEVGEGDGTVI